MNYIVVEVWRKMLSCYLRCKEAQLCWSSIGTLDTRKYKFVVFAQASVKWCEPNQISGHKISSTVMDSDVEEVNTLYMYKYNYNITVLLS